MTISPAAVGPARPTHLYLYAFGETELELPEGLTGLFDEPLRVHRHGGIAAIVSTIPGGRLRPERRHLAAHQRVLASLIGVTTVLPVGFGMLVPSLAQLDRIIDAEEDSLLEQLQALQGQVEMSIRVSWDVPNIFQHLVEQEPALKAARDTMLRNEGNHHAKVAAGELFGKVIAARRQEHERSVLAVLEAASEEIVTDAPKADNEVLRISALVRREHLPLFEQKLSEAASSFDASYRFDYSGPWAPHSFVRLRISPGAEAEAR